MRICQEGLGQQAQINEIRSKYKTGQMITFYTQLYKHGEDQVVKVRGVIEGIYKNGMQVSFRNMSGGEVHYLRRWITWKDLLLARGKALYITAGRKDDYKFTGCR